MNQSFIPNCPNPFGIAVDPSKPALVFASAAVSGLLTAAFDVPVRLHFESGDGLWPQSVSSAVRHAAVFRRSLAKRQKPIGEGG